MIASRRTSSSEERRKCYPQFGQQYFDTDFGNERDVTLETRARRIRSDRLTQTAGIEK